MENEVVLYYLIRPVIIFIWIYYDAKYRAFKQYPILWAIAGFFFPPLIIVYFMYRKPRSEIAKKSGHRNLQSLDTYLNPRDEVVNKKYHNALSLEKEKTEQLPISLKDENQTVNKPKKEQVEDKTEKYIALLKEGHITKADFMKLIGKEQDYNSSYYG